MEFFRKKQLPTTNKPKKAPVLLVDKNRCPQNHPCPAIKVCPVGALTQQGYSAPEVDMNKCIKCGKCVTFCPMGALILE